MGHIHILNKKQSEILQVNTTVLTWCLDLKKENIINAMSEESKNNLINGQREIVNIAIVNDHDEPLLVQTTTCIMKENGGLRINLPKAVRYKLQEFFPISSAISICKKKNEKYPIKSDSTLAEYIEVIPQADEKAKRSGIILKPYKRVCKTDSTSSKELRLMLSIVEEFMSTGVFTVNPKDEAKQNTQKQNRIETSHIWKSAQEYSEAEMKLTNCIYYLATDDIDKPKKVYIGEAVVMGNRIVTRKIDGITYIGHQDDVEINKFTKYRIDTLSPKSTRDVLHHAQDTIIGSACMLDKEMFPNGFELTNSAYSKAYGKAKLKRNHSK